MRQLELETKKMISTTSLHNSTAAVFIFSDDVVAGYNFY